MEAVRLRPAQCRHLLLRHPGIWSSSRLGHDQDSDGVLGVAA
jgi:hypothetical protein